MDLDTEVVRLMRVIEAIRRNGGGAKWMESQTEIMLKNALNVVYTAGYNAAQNQGVEEMAKKVERDSISWKMRLARLAVAYLNIQQCKKCGSPMVEGYQCEYCALESMKEKANG